MEELDAESMEADSPDRVNVGTILQIAHHGVLEVLHVDTNLILASRLQFQFHQRIIGTALEGAIMGDGIFAAVIVVGGISDKHLVVGQPRFHGSTILLHPSLHHSHVATILHDVVPMVGKHQVFVSRNSPCALASCWL